MVGLQGQIELEIRESILAVDHRCKNYHNDILTQKTCNLSTWSIKCYSLHGIHETVALEEL